jgi:hypothetical protein
MAKPPSPQYINHGMGVRFLYWPGIGFVFYIPTPLLLLLAENQKSIDYEVIDYRVIDYGVANELLREAERAGRAKACLCIVQALAPQQLHPEIGPYHV